MVHRLAFRAMGTDMLVCVDNGSGQSPAELADVPGWFEEWERSLSRFRVDSELNSVEPGGRPARTGLRVALTEIFQSALQMEGFTEGLVTPTIAEAVIEVGYDRDFSLLAGQTLSPFESQPANVSPLSRVTWDEASHSICLPEGVQLDFGGITKGWAAEQTVARLKHHGSALMNCGGDIAMSGALLDGSPWEIGIFKPFDRSGDYIGMMYFREACGVATSSTDRRRWMQGNVLRHHIIDPHTGLSADSDVLCATLVAPTAVEAEAAAKSALIRGGQAGIAWIESHPTLAGLLILNDGQVLYSERINQYL